MTQIIYAVCYLIVALVGFILGKYLKTSAINTDNIAAISEWVYKFVVSAKNQFIDSTGEQKRVYVTNLIKELCKKYHIQLTDEQIRALIEEAYDLMKLEEKE